MVRKSILVYDLLRSEQPQEGFSEKEIVEQISNKHDITAGKGLRRQVAVALRRGIDFGILAKKKNKFRFDPDTAKAAKKRPVASKRSRAKKKGNAKKVTKTKQQRSSNVRNKNPKQNQPVPMPRPPKAWTPNRRNLADEPASKVKKI